MFVSLSGLLRLGLGLGLGWEVWSRSVGMVMISSVGSLTYARLNPMYLIGVIPKEQLKAGA